MTSNDVREFSEALLRRVAVIKLSPLDSVQVYKLLSQTFDDKIAVLLTQVYQDTLFAKLSKPATIQELKIAGKLLEQGFSLEEVVKTVIVKNDDDFNKFSAYIATRKPYEFVRQLRSSPSTSIVEKYEGEGEIVVGEEEKKEEEKIIPERVPTIKVKPVQTEIKPIEVTEERVTSMRVVDKDSNAYSEIIKKLRPEPTDDPTRFGKFSVVKDLDEIVITSDEALKILEVKKLRLNGEFYIEDFMVCRKKLFDSFLERDNMKVVYYTKNIIAVAFDRSNEVMKAIFEKVFESNKYVIFKVKAKITGSSYLATYLDEIDRKYYSVNGYDVAEIADMVRELKDFVKFEITEDDYTGVVSIEFTDERNAVVIIRSSSVKDAMMKKFGRVSIEDFAKIWRFNHGEIETY